MLGRCCCCCFVILSIGAIITLVIWIISWPKDPHFFVENASISGYNLTADNHVTSSFTVHVSAYNPNTHYFIYYDCVMVSVHVNDTLLAYEVLPDPITQKPKARLVMNAGLVAHNVSLTSDWLPSNSTVRDLKTAGTTDFAVIVRAVTRFRFKHWKKFHHMMKAICSPITMKFNSSSEASWTQQTRCLLKVY